MKEFGFPADPDRVIPEPTGLTRGNLSVQLTRLQDTGYIDIAKEFVGRTPRTTAC